MLIDLDQAGAGTSLRARVCVVGAGIAGLLLAAKLAEGGVDVLLLEAGGLVDEDRSQSLYSAVVSGTAHTGTTEGRFRVFGGSSTRWGGQLLPYTADILEPPGGAPSIAWPIAETDVAPYYDELQRMLGVDLLPFDATLLPALGHAAVAFGPDIALRFSKWIPFARRNLAQTLGKTVLAHPRITVVTHANVSELDATSGRVTGARVLDYQRREFHATADTFIVATGTIESSRLLLLSATLPDPYRQFGRYFHDHISWPAAAFSGDARRRMLHQLGPFLVDGTLHTCKLEASPELRAKKKLLAVMAHVTIEEPEESGAAAIRRLLTSLQHGRFGEVLGRNLLPILRGLPDVLRLALAARFQQRRAVSRHAKVLLRIDLEQPPEADRSIHLSADRDALGLRKAVVDWRIGAAELDTAIRFAAVIRKELADLGLAPGDWAKTPVFTDTFHAMGGLRMGHDPSTSVVDTSLRVHGTTNLYVASCAVYPSGGSSNPTFTLMCLALRLASHLCEASASG